MPSYTNLAVIALAASTISPVLCAPTWESQKESRAVLEERFGVGADLALSFLGGAVPSFFERLLGFHSSSSSSNSSTRSYEASEARDVAESEWHAPGNDDLTKRKMQSGSFSAFLAGTALSFLGSALGSILRRDDVSLEDMLVASGLSGKRDVAYSPEDVIKALSLFNRALDELD